MNAPAGKLKRPWSRKLPSDALVVELTKLTPAPVDKDFTGMALCKPARPDELSPNTFAVLVDLCAKYSMGELMTVEDWEQYETEINELINLGLLMESWTHSPHADPPTTEVCQYIPTVYCALTCVSLTEPYQWYLDPFEPITFKNPNSEETPHDE